MPCQLTFKRYAPFTSFGGGFHGDGRTTPSYTGTARTIGIVNFDMSSGRVTGVGRSGVSFHVAAPSFRRTGITTCSISGVSHAGSSLKFTAYTEGALPLIPGAPDIDTFVDIDAMQAGTGLFVVGKVRGDNFPNAEVFLFEAGSPPAMPRAVFHYATTGGRNTGPMTRLAGAHSSQVLGMFRCTV